MVVWSDRNKCLDVNVSAITGLFRTFFGARRSGASVKIV